MHAGKANRVGGAMWVQTFFNWSTGFLWFWLTAVLIDGVGGATGGRDYEEVVSHILTHSPETCEDMKTLTLKDDV